MPKPNENRNSRCIILGCGGHGRVVLDILRTMHTYDIVGFLDSDTSLHHRRIDGVEVLGHPDEMMAIREEHWFDCAVVAIGNNGVRRGFADHLQASGIELVNAIHPSANIAQNASLGKNIVVAAGALVCAHCQIGDSVILNTGCIVDHESLVGTATHICPGARIAGRVTLESGAFVGIGATVIQSIHVGYEAVIGAGAVVIEDVPPMSTVAGVPARLTHTANATSQKNSWLISELDRAEQIARTTRQTDPTPKPVS